MKKFKGFDIVLIAILMGMVAVLDIVGVIGVPLGIISVSAFYIGSAFYLLFVYLFGWRGALAIYLGLILASVVTTGFSVMPLILALGNVLCNVFIVLMMKVLKRDCSLPTKYDIFVIIPLFIIAPLISGLWVLGGFVLFNVIPKEALLTALVGWEIGGFAVYIILGLPLLKKVSPLIKKLNI